MRDDERPAAQDIRLRAGRTTSHRYRTRAKSPRREPPIHPLTRQ
jgi:hypothetical protein